MNLRRFLPIFTIDLRSLAVFRFALGLLLTIDAFDKLIQFRDFYTDWGVMPRAYWIENYMNAWKWSFHLAMGNEWFPFLLIVIQLLASIAFLAGYRARLSGAITFILLCSLQSRNYLVLSCADDMLRMALFWSLFLPVDARFAARSRGPDDDRFVSVGSAALIVQLVLVYVITAIFKADPTWTADRSAIYYAINIDIFAKPFALLLREFPELTRWMTGATLIWELGGALLALVPGRTRLIVCALFIGLHLGFFLSFELGLFPWAAIAYWLALVPTAAWETKTGHGVQSLLERISAALGGRLPARWALPAKPFVASRWNQGFAAFFLLFVIVYCLDTVRWLPGRLPTAVINAAYVTSINQRWDMFAPYPIRNDGWFIIEGTFKDGRRFDLVTGRPKTDEKPALPSSLYPSSEWRKFMLYVWDDGNRRILLPFARHLCRRFSTANGLPSDVSTLQIEFMKETTPPFGEPWPPAQKVLLWSHDCFAP